MSDTMEMRLGASALERYALPDVGYPLPMDAFKQAMVADGELPFAVMLLNLQLKAAEDDADWKGIEPAMDRLAALIAPADDRSVLIAEGDDWWLEIGPVDLNDTIITIQRRDDLLVAIAQRDDGRLRVAVYRPLDARSARSLISLGRKPDPVHGVCLRENNWEYALDASAGFGQMYACDAGRSYMSYWEHGLGLSHDRTIVDEWHAQRGLSARRSNVVATELGVYYTLHDELGQKQDVSLPKLEEAPMDKPGPTWLGRRQRKQTILARFRGCLLGGAVGDALGAAVEFDSLESIRCKHGARGLTDYAAAYGGIGKITDDTQMTLFTAEGLLRGWVRGCLKGITSYASTTGYAYLRWLVTQTDRGSRSALTFPEESGWLITHPELHSRRAPGYTCLAALRSARSSGASAENDSKGCGAVMRMAPVGLFAWHFREGQPPNKTFELAVELSRLTHGHPSGSLPAGVLAVMITALVDGASLDDALQAAKLCLCVWPHREETLAAIEKAERLAKGSTPRIDAIRELGQGWVAEEALAISIYCALVARSFREGVLLAVNHDGDSDSTGAITGNILGAAMGLKAIPGHWLDRLELRDVIDEVANDLHDFPGWNIGDDSGDQAQTERIWAKYPGA